MYYNFQHRLIGGSGRVVSTSPQRGSRRVGSLSLYASKLLKSLTELLQIFSKALDLLWKLWVHALWILLIDFDREQDRFLSRFDLLLERIHFLTKQLLLETERAVRPRHSLSDGFCQGRFDDSWFSYLPILLESV